MTSTFKCRSCALAISASFACNLALAQAVQTPPLTQAEIDRTKQIIMKDEKPKGPVNVDQPQGRVTVEGKSGVGAYAEGHTSPPSKDNPKGEHEVGAGALYRFGGSNQPGNSQPAQETPKKSTATPGQNTN